MGIKNQSDTSNTLLNGHIAGLYYYFIPVNKQDKANYIGFVNNIVNMCFNPFLTQDDLTLWASSFNTEKYGKPTDGTIPTVYRIATGTMIEKILYQLDLKYSNTKYPVKLETYPYKYYILTDYVNPPIMIKPQLLKDGKIKIKVKTCVSTEGKYNLSIEGYKGDNEGNVEGQNSTASFMCATSGSAYSNFLATSSAQFAQEKINLSLENDLTLKQSFRNNSLELMQNNFNNGKNQLGNLMGGLSSLLGGNIGGVGGSITNSILQNGQNNLNKQFIENSLTNANENYSLKEQTIANMTQAKISDMLSTPKSLITSGNDTLYNFNLSKRRIDLLEYSIHDNYKMKISEYFTRYGYKANIYNNIYDLKNTRKYWNYIKTSLANIQGDNIPIEHLEEIKQIFNNGLTFWHIENGAKVGIYSMDNKEI